MIPVLFKKIGIFMCITYVKRKKTNPLKCNLDSGIEIVLIFFIIFYIFLIFSPRRMYCFYNQKNIRNIFNNFLAHILLQQSKLSCLIEI